MGIISMIRQAFSNNWQGGGIDVTRKSYSEDYEIDLSKTLSTLLAADSVIAWDNSEEEFKKITGTNLFGDIRAPIVFGSLGTATKGIDLSGSGLSGGDSLVYISTIQFWKGTGIGAERFTCGNNDSNYGFEAPTNLYIFAAITNPGNVFVQAKSDSAFLAGNKTLVGSLTDCTSNGTTTITKTAHGLTLAAGELVHITDATTAADEGFYRIVSSTVDTIVVDRALSGSDADVDLTVYKDVIGFFASDGTNGQRIMGYSAQDKPLQIGGDTLTVTGRSLGAEDVLIAGTLFEVDSIFHFDNYGYFHSTVVFEGTTRIVDIQMLSLGNDNDARFYYETADPDAHKLILALPNGGAINVPVFVIGDQGIIDNNLGWFDGVTGPRTAWVDADEDSYITLGASNTDDYFEETLGGNAVALIHGGARAYTPDAITATSAGVAASVATVVTEITTNGDSDLDNVTLTAGVDGQIKIFSVVAVGNAADSVKVTPASMIGGTQITFGASPLGLGCVMVYDAGAAGWVVVANNGGTIA